MKRTLVAVLGLLALVSCASKNELRFPKDFLFGTSVAGFQVDMGCPTLARSVCEDRNSDWYQYVTSPETLNDPNARLSGDPPSFGPGEWELFTADYDLAARELHNDAFRMSVEWSRIFPRPTDGVEGYEALKAIASADAIAKYHDMFEALRARGLRPLVTLYHYTLPIWIHDTIGCHADLATCSPKGWVDRDRTVREIAKYAGFVAREFGGEVDLWVTLNEPFTSIAVAGYLFQTEFRTNPPGVALKIPEFKTVTLALIEAHARMYDAVKANDNLDAERNGNPSEVGVAYPMLPVMPRDPARPLDVRAAENFSYLWNRVYLDAVVKGDLDANLDGSKVARPDLVNRMDYVGINYYGRAIVEGIEGSPAPSLSPLLTFNPISVQYVQDYPRGLYDMIMLVKSWGKPIYVTENGIPDAQDDGRSSEYIVRHLIWVHRAIRDGADVRGYFYWTLLDNYEWQQGMNVSFGLYGVRRDDPMKQRTPRKSVATYRRVAETKSIPADLAAKYPEPK